MFKISFFIHKKPEIPVVDFRDYWLGEHADRQKDYLEKLGVRVMIKNEALPENPTGVGAVEAYGTQGGYYDFVDQWIFNDIEDLKKGSASPAVQSAMQEVFNSEEAFIDHSRCSVMMQVDLVQFFPVDANEVYALEDNTFVKIMYCARALSGITRQQAQLHWNACHGAVSRQDIKYSVQKKYVQAHKIDATFVDQLIAQRGYEQDDTWIGCAEGWIDEAQSSKDFPEEETSEVVAMSMDDIDLFADKTRSQLFVCKEHLIINKKIITRPMPEFFSAVY